MVLPKANDGVVVAFVVLQGDFDFDFVGLRVKSESAWRCEGGFVLVQMLAKRRQTAFVLINLDGRRLDAMIFQRELAPSAPDTKVRANAW